MEVIMMTCIGCGLKYLTPYKTGISECPVCQYQNQLLVGKEAVDALLEHERVLK